MKEKQHSTGGFIKSYGNILETIDSFFYDAFKHFHQNDMFLQPIPIKTYENGTEWVVEAALPGIKKDQIQLDVHQNYLRIKVQHEEMTEEKNDVKSSVTTHYSNQMRERVIQLPFTITKTDVNASYSNGLLIVKIPYHRQQIDIK